MIISHEFYLHDVIARVADASASTLSSAVDVARTAIVESSLLPSQKREFTTLLKQAATKRVADLLVPMNYKVLRHSLAPVMKWIIEGEDASPYVHALVSVIESQAIPAASSPANYGLLDPDDEDEEWEIHADIVAWRLLLDYDGQIAFPHTSIDNEDDDEDSYHFKWKEFVGAHRWTLPHLHEEISEHAVTEAAPAESLKDIEILLRHARADCWLRLMLVPSSCPELLIFNPSLGGVAETIIPRHLVMLAVRFDADSLVSITPAGLQLDNVMVMFTPCDVSMKVAFEGHLPNRQHASLIIGRDGSVAFL